MSKNNYGVQFLSPLVESEKITGLNDQTARSFLGDIAKPFYRDSPVYQQLASFIGNQLAAQPNFQRVNLYNDSGAGEYNPDDQTLYIHSKFFPVRTFIHEGTHALDNREDPQKRSYQNEAINFLAKRLGNRPMTDDKGYWYENARKILHNGTFKGNNYKFGKFTTDPKNVQDGIPYGKDFSGGIRQEGQELLRQPNPNLSYSDIQSRLNQIRPDVSSRPFYPFSEFPAFAVESLGNNWGIKQQNPGFYHKKDIFDNNDKEHGQNLGRKFLKSMLKATYRNFQDLHNQQQREEQPAPFAQAYPAANQAFLDRLSQLRNYAKYPNQNAFIEKMQRTSAPGYQSNFSASNSSPVFNQGSSSSINPLVQSLQPIMNQQSQQLPPIPNLSFSEENVDRLNPQQPNPRLTSHNPLLQNLEMGGPFSVSQSNSRKRKRNP